MSCKLSVTWICLPSTTQPPAVNLLLLHPWHRCCCSLPPRPRRAAGASLASGEELEDRKTQKRHVTIKVYTPFFILSSVFFLCVFSKCPSITTHFTSFLVGTVFTTIHQKMIKNRSIHLQHAHILHMQMINTELYLHLHTNAAAEQLVTVLLLITQANSGMTNTAHTSSQ